MKCSYSRIQARARELGCTVWPSGQGDWIVVEKESGEVIGHFTLLEEVESYLEGEDHDRLFLDAN